MSCTAEWREQHGKNYGCSKYSFVAGFFAYMTIGLWGELPGLMFGIVVATVLLYLGGMYRLRRPDAAMNSAVSSRDYAGGLALAEKHGPTKKRSLAFQHGAALCHWHSGDRDAALSVMDEATKGSHYRLIACFDHIGMLLEEREHPRAILQAENLLRKLKRFSSTPQHTIFASRVHIIRGQETEAKALLSEALEKHPNHLGLRAQLAALRLSQGRTTEAASILEAVLRDKPQHPHARVLQARLSGTEADHEAAEAAIAAEPESFVSAELSERHRFRLAQVDKLHMGQPSHLDVQNDLQGMQYTVSTWERLRPMLRVVKILIATLTAGLLLTMFGSSELLDQSLLVMLGLWTVGLSGTGLVLSFLGFSGMVLFGRRMFQAGVTLDQNGMHIQRYRSTERVLWHECTAIRRKGRRIEVLRNDIWETLPAPNATSDAEWLEAKIREQLKLKRHAPRAVPEEAAAALQALKQKT